MLLSFSKEEPNDCFPSYQDYLCAQGEFESFIISLLKCQNNSREKKSENSNFFQEPCDIVVNNTFLSNISDESQQLLNVILSPNNENKNNDNVPKDNKIIKNKKDLKSSHNSSVYFIKSKKNKKNKRFKRYKKYCKINSNTTIKYNFPKKVYKKRKIIFYKSIITKTYLIRLCNDCFKLIINKIIFFAKKAKIKIFFPSWKKSAEHISNIIKYLNRKNCTHIWMERKKNHKILFNFKELCKLINIYNTFYNICVNIIIIIIITIIIDILILVLKNELLDKKVTRFISNKKQKTQ